MNLTLFNSLTRKREVLIPIDVNLVQMYVCGPTVYDHPHIGNARSVVVYDVLYRILIKIYGKQQVRYVRNITDIDDKIIIKAKQDNISINELTQKTTKFFHEDMDYLGCLRPDFEPKATDHVEEMIDIINKLISKVAAYQINGHVYFDVGCAKNYLALSGRSSDEMLDDIHIENSKDKKNSGDFVLWKPSKDGDDASACFDSPFGRGRPGWHIECSAMSHKYLGENFDIHGGGADLIFPHHTNEIAQSCTAFPESKFAKIWVHNGFLTVNHEKMSKSLGNFLTVQDLISKRIKGDTLRLFLLSSHYRKPIDYNEKAISDANNMLSYWYRAIEDLPEEQLHVVKELPQAFLDALLDDLNTHNALKITNDFAKQLHITKNNVQKIEIANNLLSCARFFGLMSVSSKEWFQSGQNAENIEQLIAQRLEAKKSKNWTKADDIRAELLALDIVIEDKNDGSTIWKKKN